jgi:outer membrane protein OmpA-like peptidoglycan-associated protein
MAIERGRQRNRICFILGLTSGALMGMLLTGCGLSLTPQPAPAVPPQPHDLRPAPAWVVDRMARAAPDLYFGLNSHLLPGRERRKLAQIAPALQGILHDFPDLIIVIEGHSDDRGLTEYNQRLGSERANAVRRVLLNLSFPEDHVRAVSLGESARQCLTPDEKCRQKNRRVHFRAAQLKSGIPGKKQSMLGVVTMPGGLWCRIFCSGPLLACWREEEPHQHQPRVNQRNG